MERLLQIGFRPIGRWELQGDQLRLRLEQLPTHQRALYAFATGKTVLYVGKTSGTLPIRLAAYVSPHPTQRTNVRNNASLRELLKAGRPIDILGWIDPGLQRVGAFDLNLAAGLEDSIIAVLEPPWNGGRASTPSPAAIQSPAVPTSATAGTTVSVASLTTPHLPTKVNVPHDRAPMVASGSSSAHAHAHARFTVRLGKTYYNQGFFNVPVAFSHHFGEHGAAVKLYCGSERALLMGVLDRKANQNSKTPRIYGKTELARWIQGRLKLDGFLEVTVVGPAELLLN